MIQTSLKNIHQLRQLLQKIPIEAYIYQSIWLSGASIGQHVRHVLEFYTCLLDGINRSSDAEKVEVPVVNYDKRARDFDIETNPDAALKSLKAICDGLLSNQNWLLELHIEGSLDPSTDTDFAIMSSFDRELLYNLDHTIHHQALIKVGLLEQNLHHLLDESFGLAPSTIKSRS